MKWRLPFAGLSPPKSSKCRPCVGVPLLGRGERHQTMLEPGVATRRRPGPRRRPAMRTSLSQLQRTERASGADIERWEGVTGLW